MAHAVSIPGIGDIPPHSGMKPIDVGGDGLFRAGQGGVRTIVVTGDGKVEFVAFADRTIACVRSAMGYPAIYPLEPARIETPVEAVLMDLDGTSVHSEPFWIWIIQSTMAELMGDPGFELEGADEPHVSGHSVSEHLQYCIGKYCPDKRVEDARMIYFRVTARELEAIMAGTGRTDAFVAWSPAGCTRRPGRRSSPPSGRWGWGTRWPSTTPSSLPVRPSARARPARWVSFRPNPTPGCTPR